jgi:hypothetical protein
MYVWLALVVVLLVGLGVGAWWVRRREQEIGPLEGDQTDEQRRATQLGIGLAGGGGSMLGGR